MRQIWITAPAGSEGKIKQAIEAFKTEHKIEFKAQRSDQEMNVVVVNVPNQDISEVIHRLKGIAEVEVLLSPQEIYPLVPGREEVAPSLLKVTHRSPLEVWLNGLQSIGSWKGFLGYAIGASAVVWIALYTNTIYLLVAAMLIAPFAGPAMSLAIATAAGDTKLLKRSIIRYFIALIVTVAGTAGLSLLVGQEAATNMMVQISEVSSLSLFLPLVAGAAGALNLTQASNSSLVPGTAVGTLVAASLAPPAGVIGMAISLGRWDMAVNGTFVLLLQLFAINLAGGFVFRAFRLKPGSTHFERGSKKLFFLSTGLSVLALAGLLGWQFSSTPGLQRATRAQSAGESVQQIVRNYPYADLVEVSVRFPRPDVERQNILLAEIYVTRRPDVLPSQEWIRDGLTELVQQELRDEFNVQPVVSVTVLQP